MTASGLLSTSEVAHRLGVRRETVYAYVSRGMLERHEASGHRRSLFDPAAVEQLAARARRGDRSGALDVVIETRLTSLDPDGRLFYRGHDVIELARFRSFEQVAGLLWDGDPCAPWELEPRSAAAVVRLRDALDEDTPAVERLPVVVSGLGAADIRRGDRRPEAVRRAGARMLAGALDALPKPDEPADRSAAGRLWAALSEDGRPPRPAQRAALDAALVLLADHELAASTLAVRIAASTWADPYLLVGAGLAVAGGPLHGGASEAVRSLVREVTGGTSAAVAVGARLRDARPVPGFGHAVYDGPDPRAPALIGAVRRTRPPRAVMRAVDDVERLVAGDGDVYPNIDFALGAFAEAHDMVRGAGEAIFVTARCAGWIAHGLEEYEHRLRFRIRAAYTGPEPDWV
jgi:citrate synthase